VQIDDGGVEVHEDQQLGARPPGQQVVLVGADADEGPAEPADVGLEELETRLVADPVVRVTDQRAGMWIGDESPERGGESARQGGQRWAAERGRGTEDEGPVTGSRW
jgi:hypothetical protein